MLGLKEDFIYALRQLSRHRGHAAVVVLTLSLGFGANTAVFGVVGRRAAPAAAGRGSLRPSPLSVDVGAEPRRRVPDGRVVAGGGDRPRDHVVLLLSGVRGDRSTTLAATFAWAELRRASLTVEGEAELAAGQLVSGGYYSGLGVPAILGRTITPEDDRAGTELVAVIGHGYCLRRLGGAPG